MTETVATRSWSWRQSFALSIALLVSFVGYTCLAVSWGPFVRLDIDLNRNFHVHPWWPVLHVLDRIGQRAVCLPALALVAGFAGWRRRSWRPVLLCLMGVLLVNLVVLVAKLALGRGRPLSGQSFFTDGDLYPSGHAANVAVAYGLCYYLLVRYGSAGSGTKRLLRVVLCALSLAMFATSLLLRWHWFSDLVAGFLIGGAVLALAIGIEAALQARAQRWIVVPVPEAAAASEDSLAGVRRRRNSVADRLTRPIRERPPAALIGRFEPP